MEPSDLDEVRHDLKNVMTALRSGCLLIESALPAASQPELREILREMRAELDKATGLIARLKGTERATGSPAPGLARTQGRS